MNTVRKDFAAVWADDGKIYVLGGHDDEGDSLNTVESFDSQSNSWTMMPSMRTARSNFAAAVLNGEIFALGGLDMMYDKLSTVERFVPRASTWVVADAMDTARSDHVAAVLGDPM